MKLVNIAYSKCVGINLVGSSPITATIGANT